MNTQYDAGLEILTYLSLIMLIAPGLFALWYYSKNEGKVHTENRPNVVEFPKPRIHRPAA